MSVFGREFGRVFGRFIHYEPIRSLFLVHNCCIDFCFRICHYQSIFTQLSEKQICGAIESTRAQGNTQTRRRNHESVFRTVWSTVHAFRPIPAIYSPVLNHMLECTPSSAHSRFFTYLSVTLVADGGIECSRFVPFAVWNFGQWEWLAGGPLVDTRSVVVGTTKSVWDRGLKLRQ